MFAAKFFSGADFRGDLTLQSAMGECVDLLVIGGGVNGAGIARDAAGRGLKVALVEQSDLAAATSSASTKLIHGGLRYLEFLEFRLVREALIERERLLKIAPHLIRPMQFVLPHVKGLRPRWQIRAGLFLYDHLGGRRKLPASRAVRLDSGAFGALQSGIDHGFVYADCWVDDSRLVILNALDAAERGAAIHTRTRFASASVDGGLWIARCDSQRTGEPFQIRARAIVNAAGPWVEAVLRSLPQAQTDAQVRLVKGSHIVVPRLFNGEHAFMLQNPDGRIVFTIPYEQRYTLIGTTDVPFEGDPAQVRISSDEIAYLCSTVNAYFQHGVALADVRWSYAGVRPLSDDESANASKVTRDYRLELAGATTHPPLLSVFGGKLTTYRRLAEMALEKLQPHIGGREQRWTDKSPLPGGDLPRADFDAFLSEVRQRWTFLSGDQAQRLARAYGTRIEKILGPAQRLGELGEYFGAGLTRAEVEYLIGNEWAVSADDILWRRTKCGLHMSHAERERFARVFSQAGAHSRPDHKLRQQFPRVAQSTPCHPRGLAVKQAFLDRLRDATRQLQEQGLFKPERVLTSPQQAVVQAANGQEVINLCANNYLGLANHPAVRQAAQLALDQYGYGMASVRFICGTHSIHKNLEERLSRFLGTDDTMLYSSCFDANGGLFETVLDEQDAVISDELNHASIIDGVRLCRAQRFRYAHNDLDELEARLREASRHRVRLIATDGVFSMDGVIAQLQNICALADQYDALVMVDDSHATGFIGEQGRGTHELRGVMDRVDILTGTFGKALGGGSGGYTSGRKEIIAWLRQRSRPYLFSNSIPPLIAAASVRVLDLLAEDAGLRVRLHQNAAFFRERMTAAGFNLIPGEHPIIPVMLGDARLASEFAQRLLEHGVYVIGFSFPVVAQGKARIRTQMSAAHTQQHLEKAVDAFVRVGRELGVVS